MSMRQLAAEVGVQEAALYRYYPTKEELLYSLMLTHMQALHAAWDTARPRDDDPVLRLEAFLDNHIRFHLAERHSTHVNNMELRSLSEPKLRDILKSRAAYENELRQILSDGMRAGVFIEEDVVLTSMAIIQMVTGAIVWFRPDERLSVNDVAARYHAMTMRLVGADAREKKRVPVYDEVRA
jgi:AcrR family transcriptional regulator